MVVNGNNLSKTIFVFFGAVCHVIEVIIRPIFVLCRNGRCQGSNNLKQSLFSVELSDVHLQQIEELIESSWIVTKGNKEMIKSGFTYYSLKK